MANHYRITESDIKSDFLYRLESFEGQEFYLSDMSYYLSQEENESGSWYGSECGEFLRNNSELFAILYDNMISYQGVDAVYSLHINPFTDLDRLMCCMWINFYDVLWMLVADEVLNHVYDDEVSISKEFIAKCKAFLDSFDLVAYINKMSNNGAVWSGDDSLLDKVYR